MHHIKKFITQTYYNWNYKHGNVKENVSCVISGIYVLIIFWDWVKRWKFCYFVKYHLCHQNYVGMDYPPSIFRSTPQLRFTHPLILKFFNPLPPPPLFNILESPYPSFVTGEERGFKLCLERLSVTQSKKHLFSQLEFIIFLQRCTSVSLDFSDTLMNIFTSFMPNKWVTIDGKYPPWMTEKIKQKMEQKKSFYKHLSNNGKRESDFVKLQSMVNELSEIISKRQYDYLDEISKKLQFFIYHSANSSIIVK